MFTDKDRRSATKAGIAQIAGQTIDVADQGHWHRLRRQFIGSSEAPMLYGLAPTMGSARTVYALKRGEATEVDLSQELRVVAGTYLEDGIRAIVEHVLRIPVWKPDFYVTHPDRGRTRMGLSLDGIVHLPKGYASEHLQVIGGKPIDDGWYSVEIKNVALDQTNKWLDAGGNPFVPLRVQMQDQHGLACLGSAFKGCLTVALEGGNNPKFYLVPRDEVVISDHENYCEAFWHRHVIPGVPPAVDGSEACTATMIEAMLQMQRLPALELPIDDPLYPLLARREMAYDANQATDETLAELNNEIREILIARQTEYRETYEAQCDALARRLSISRAEFDALDERKLTDKLKKIGLTKDDKPDRKNQDRIRCGEYSVSFGLQDQVLADEDYIAGEVAKLREKQEKGEPVRRASRALRVNTSLKRRAEMAAVQEVA